MKIINREAKHTSIGLPYETKETKWTIVLPENHALYDRFMSVEVRQIEWPNDDRPDHGMTHMRGTHTTWFSMDNKDKQKKQIFREVEEFLIKADTANPMLYFYKPQLQH